MIETVIFAALKDLFSDRVFPDIAPQDVELPYCTYQQVGGLANNYVEAAPVDKKNGRYQINVWAATRLEVSNLIEQVEDILVSPPVKANVLGAPIARLDEEAQLRGAMQDFSIWS